MPFDPQVYRLASIARDKLCREAARASHNLRILVAHANILDELLIELNATAGESTEHYGFDLLPQKVHTERSAPRNVVVSVQESSGHEDDQGASNHLGSSPSNLPMLSHDSETDSDSASDDSDDSDDSEDFSIISPSTSPTDSTEMDSVEDLEPKGVLGLRRTKSVWRLFGSKESSSEERKRKDKVSMNNSANDFERLKLSGT